MRARPSTDLPGKGQTMAWSEVIAGYLLATLGLVALLTINGAAGFPGAIGIGTAVLVAIGLLLPAVGMLQLRRAVNHDRRAARYGLAMQALGLIGLLFGVLPLASSSTISALFVVSAILIATSAAFALGGALLLRHHYTDIGASNGQGVDYLILGTTLIFFGVALILGSNLGKFFFLSEVGNTVYTDVGAAVAACGCVIAAYAFFVLKPRSSASLAAPRLAVPTPGSAVDKKLAPRRGIDVGLSSGDHFSSQAGGTL